MIVFDPFGDVTATTWPRPSVESLLIRRTTHTVFGGTVGDMSDEEPVRCNVATKSDVTTATGAHDKIDAMRHQVIASIVDDRL